METGNLLSAVQNFLKEVLMELKEKLKKLWKR